ncbi:MAG TPA: LuxR C-terminal-related transcriptional regulator [Actinoplanes sp.]|nr:LuxR C-terminal-related transcriptional regulator [Actinoplanes sp.]
MTAVQRQIAILVTEGLTNQAIANRLGLTRSMVSQHVAMILWRLGLTTRSEIALWALKQVGDSTARPEQTWPGLS